MPKFRNIHGFKGFISFEGIEGSGKSTQTKLLAERLQSEGYTVVSTEEPGGTKVGNSIRSLLLYTDDNISPLTELLLYAASRAQHIREVIYTSLTNNMIVITDRYSDSTLAYQGYARGIDLSLILSLDEMVTTNLKPYVTFLLDLDVEEGLRRNRKAKKEDRFELETLDFHKRVRQGYLQIAKNEPKRVKVIPAENSPEEIHGRIVKFLEEVWQ